MTETTYSTSQTAQKAGVSRKALRLYEQRGLLPAPMRTAAGYRRYTATDLDALVFIRRARALGLGLHDIATVLSLHQQGRAPCDDVRTLLDDRITEVDATIAELQALRTTLAAARTQPAAAGSSRWICPVIEHATETADQHRTAPTTQA
jgi:DNA-binding transcriptional MerR regulator